MDTALSPAYKRQIIFVASAFGVGLVMTVFFGFVIGFAINTVLLVAITFYIRYRSTKALKSFGFGSNAPGREYETGSTKLKYVCLACGAQVNGARCDKCGSNMKKPIF